MKEFIQQKDAVGSLYFDFETQKTFGMIATNFELKEDKNVDIKIEKVIPRVHFEAEGKKDKEAENNLIEKIKLHWILRPEDANTTMVNFLFFLKHQNWYILIFYVITLI